MASPSAAIDVDAAPSSRIVRGTGSSAAPLELASSSDDEAAAQPAREPAREPAPAAKRSDDEAAAQPAAKRPRVVDTLEALMRSARGSGRQPPWAACVCGIGDTSRCRALLKRYGCVIFRGVATGPECAELEGLFWDWLEREHPSVDRSRPATHAPHVFEALGYKNTGVVNTGSIGQSDFLWRARTLSRMVEAWRTVWGLSADERLLTSFDGAGVHRNPCHPAHAGRGVRTDQKWYHLDQGPRQPGFVGYQGVLTIFPATGKRARRSCAPAPTRTMRRTARAAESSREGHSCGSRRRATPSTVWPRRSSSRRSARATWSSGIRGSCIAPTARPQACALSMCTRRAVCRPRRPPHRFFVSSPT